MLKGWQKGVLGVSFFLLVYLFLWLVSCLFGKVVQAFNCLFFGFGMVVFFFCSVYFPFLFSVLMTNPLFLAFLLFFGLSKKVNLCF